MAYCGLRSMRNEPWYLSKVMLFLKTANLALVYSYKGIITRGL